MNAAQDPRGETPAQRDDRNMMELLQELRVAGIGVQVLFGFLLSLPFTNRFVKLGPAQRGVYIADLLLCVLSTALLLAPVAYHRLVFRRHLKESLVRHANTMAIAGLTCVGLAVTAGVVLVVSFVAPKAPAIIIGIFVVCLFATLWFVVPLAKRQSTADQERPGQPPGGHNIER